MNEGGYRSASRLALWASTLFVAAVTALLDAQPTPGKEKKSLSASASRGSFPSPQRLHHKKPGLQSRK
jgi:hypothetical protein